MLVGRGILHQNDRGYFISNAKKDNLKISNVKKILVWALSCLLGFAIARISFLKQQLIEKSRFWSVNQFLGSIRYYE